MLITGDTIVVLDDIIYEKPTSKEHAVQMLQALSNSTHQVMTAVWITILH